jgi:hypothetical protein
MRSSGKARKAKKNPQRLGQGSSFNHGRDCGEEGTRERIMHGSKPSCKGQQNPLRIQRAHCTQFNGETHEQDDTHTGSR